MLEHSRGQAFSRDSGDGPFFADAVAKHLARKPGLSRSRGAKAGQSLLRRSSSRGRRLGRRNGRRVAYTCRGQLRLVELQPMPLFETVTNLIEGADRLRRRRYGMIEVADGRFRRVVLRPLPKIVSAPGILFLGQWRHRHRPGRFDSDLLRSTAAVSQLSRAEVRRVDRRHEHGHAHPGVGRAGRDRPAEAKRRPALRRRQRTNHDQAVEPLGMGAALPVVVPPALHQAVLRRLSFAAAMDLSASTGAVRHGYLAAI